jgi:hypothetical protein
MGATQSNSEASCRPHKLHWSVSGPAAPVPSRFGKPRDEFWRLTRSRSSPRPPQSIPSTCAAPKDTGIGETKFIFDIGVTLQTWRAEWKAMVPPGAFKSPMRRVQPYSTSTTSLGQGRLMSKAKACRELGSCSDRSHLRPCDTHSGLASGKSTRSSAEPREVKKYASIICARLFAPRWLISLLN